MNSNILHIWFLSLLFFSCLGKKKDRNTEKNQLANIETISSVKDTSLSKGFIHPKIFCQRDSTQSYALYLPKNYFIDKKFPIIYFFDSHAEGALPVEKYKSLAEKYGYIIAGSNNSKNGLSPEFSQQIIKLFFDNTREKFSIDAKRIYTGGFSGGARVASSIALNNGKIEGVVGCGAGFPNSNEPISAKFNFVGIAGNADFNLIELKNLDRTLESSSIEHQLFIFDGKHEWPPIEIMEEAFLSFEISAMKKGITGRNDSLIQNYIQKKEKEILKCRNKKQILECWNLLRKLSTAIYGLSDIEKYKSEYISLEQSSEFMPALKKAMDAEKSEIEKQQEYSKYFTSKNSDWWNSEIKNLKNGKSLESKRLLGYLGLVSYMYSSGALNKNMLPQADNFLKIYALVEPQNPEHQYLRAQLFMKMNEPEKALTSLKSAMSLGFTDKTRLENDEIFSSLRNEQGYKEIEMQLEK